MHPFGSPRDPDADDRPGAGGDALGALVDAMPLPALVTRTGRIAYANRAARTLIGRGPVGLCLDDLVVPADCERLVDALDRCAIRGACGEVDVRLCVGQGTVDARVEIMPLPGRPQPMGLLLHDLGGMRVAERALRESEDRYRLLVEHSPDAIYLTSGVASRMPIPPPPGSWGSRVPMILSVATYWITCIPTTATSSLIASPRPPASGGPLST